MELRYMGFDQTQSKRCYRFDRVAKGEPTIRLEVFADMGLFQKHHIAIQEGPTLCANKLTNDLAAARRGVHELTNDDLLAYVSAREAVEAKRAERRRTSFRRRKAAS